MCVLLRIISIWHLYHIMLMHLWQEMDKKALDEKKRQLEVIVFLIVFDKTNYIQVSINSHIWWNPHSSPKSAFVFSHSAWASICCASNKKQCMRSATRNLEIPPSTFGWDEGQERTARGWLYYSSSMFLKCAYNTLRIVICLLREVSAIQNV